MMRAGLQAPQIRRHQAAPLPQRPQQPVFLSPVQPRLDQLVQRPVTCFASAEQTATSTSSTAPGAPQQHHTDNGRLHADNSTGVASTSAPSPKNSMEDLKLVSDEDEDYDGIVSEPTKRPTGLHVRVRNMVKHFNTAKGLFKAVNGVDVDIEPSTIVALLGPSGSGKTTLLRLVAGLEQPTDGKIYFDSTDATELSVQERQIGFVFQSYALFAHKTVRENIKFGLEMRNLAVDHDKRVNDLLQLVQLTGLGDRYPRQLSGGQRQRVALARALASNPKLLLLDEPFGALDAVVRKQLRSGLREIVRSVGVTTIIVTHDQEEAFDLADKVVVFNRGHIEQQGAPSDIIKSPKTPFIMKFVGETNSMPASSLLAKRMKFTTDKRSVLFRPHDIQLFRHPPEDESKPYLPVHIAEKHNFGWVVKYTLKSEDDVEFEFTVSRDQDESQYNIDEGTRVYVHVKPQAMMGFNPEDVDSAPIV